MQIVRSTLGTTRARADRFSFAHRRAVAVLGALTILGLLLGDVAAALAVGARGTPVSVNSALAQYRARAKAAPSPAPAATVPASAAAVTTPAATTASSPGAPARRASASPHAPVSAAAPAGPEPTLAAPGVYVYATEGYEKLNVPNSRRDFPSQTTITVENQGCGVVETWKPFAEHSEATQVCVTAGTVRVVSYEQSVTYYGNTDHKVFACDPDAHFFLAEAKPGQSWRFSCSSSDATANQTASVIGYEPITIAGTTVNTIHVHVDVALTGTSQGTSPADYWFTTDGSRLVKNTGSVDSTQSGPFGTVHYNEVYALQLVSLQPQR